MASSASSSLTLVSMAVLGLLGAGEDNVAEVVGAFGGATLVGNLSVGSPELKLAGGLLALPSRVVGRIGLVMVMLRPLMVAPRNSGL